MKKVISFILSVIMLLSVVPLTASAGTVSGTCGDNLTWTFDDSTGTLTISGTGAMYDCSAGDCPWESHKGGIEIVVISDGVTTIGDWAFEGCNSLTSVTIPDSVIIIGARAFAYCHGLTSVIIPDSVMKIEGNIFDACSRLTSVFVDSNNKHYSSDEHGVLFDKDKTTLIQYPAGNKAKSYVIPDSVTTIDNFAFDYCDSLTSITIPDSVTTIGQCAFEGCDSLTSITIPSGVTTIEYMAFAFCNSLTSITIPDSVTTIGHSAFEGCGSFTSITIPDSVTTISDQAFFSCNSLESITIPDSVTTIGKGAFGYCNSLTSVIVDVNNQYYSSDEYGVLFNKDKTRLVQYPIGNMRTSYIIPDSVTTIGYYAFDWRNSLKSITIPTSVTTIEICAFSYCYDLADVFYLGSEKNWNEIVVEKGYNECLLNARIHFNNCKGFYKVAVVIPTCTNNGYTTYSCDCGYSYEDDYVDYSHNYDMIITYPTCTEKGFTTYTCSVCGDSYVDNYEGAIGHKYVSVITPPTCTEDGYETFTCECGDSYVKVFKKAKGHTPAKVVSENRVAPTCIENGSKDFVVYCSICGEEISRETVVLEARGHINTDNDGCCDDCGELIEPITECDHSCHKDGFTGFFWKIINLFNRLFRTNKYCECGVVHY